MSRRGHTAALKKLSRNPRCVTYNLGTGTGYSVLQVRRTNEREILTSELVGSEESLNATDRQGLRRGEQEGDTDADCASSAGGRRAGDASARRPWGAMGYGGQHGREAHVPRRQRAFLLLSRTQVYADPSLAARELGWKAELGIEQMCADSWRWIEANPNGFGTP